MLPDRITGLDGRSYPRPGTVDRLHAIARAHHHAHLGLTVRAVQDALAAEGITRSLGTISGDLRRWRCRDCSGAAKEAPEQ